MFHSVHVDDRRSITTIHAALTAAALVIAGVGTVHGQPTDRARSAHEVSTSAALDKKALTGSWVDTVMFPPEIGRPPLKSLVSFHDDGIMTYSDQGTVTIEPPTVFSSGRGVWKQLDKRTFAYTAVGLISNLSGNLVGYLKTRGIYTLSQSGNEYSGTTVAEVLDTDGAPLFPAIEVTNAGRRIQLEVP
jgi:hypothetical protein